MMDCSCCKARMELFRKNEKWDYFKCNYCGLITSRGKDGAFPKFEYNGTETTDADSTSPWDNRVEEATRVMYHKMKLLGMEKNGVFLDVGCSEGMYVEAMQRIGYDSYGFEVDKVKVKNAGAHLNITEPQYEKMKEETFDFIMTRHTIEHVGDFMNILLSCKRLLKEDGILCVETPNQGSAKCILQGKRIRENRFLGHVYPPTHINGFSKKTYRAIADLLDLEIVLIKTYSPADPNWCCTSAYRKRGLVPLIHKLTSLLGFGEGLSVFYKKRR